MEAAKKNIFFSGPTNKRGGLGVKAGPLRKKNFFEAPKKSSEKNDDR